MRWLVVLAAALGGCQVAAEAPDYDEFEVTWTLVDLPVTAPAGDASVSAIPTLMLQPEVTRPAVVTRILNEDAGVGQPAVMEVRVIGVHRRVRLHLQPSRTGVRVLGPEYVDVEGERPFTVRFTCDSPGRASLVPTVVDAPQ